MGLTYSNENIDDDDDFTMSGTVSTSTPDDLASSMAAMSVTPPKEKPTMVPIVATWTHSKTNPVPAVRKYVAEHPEFHILARLTLEASDTTDALLGRFLQDHFLAGVQPFSDGFTGYEAFSERVAAKPHEATYATLTRTLYAKEKTGDRVSFLLRIEYEPNQPLYSGYTSTLRYLAVGMSTRSSDTSKEELSLLYDRLTSAKAEELHSPPASPPATSK